MSIETKSNPVANIEHICDRNRGKNVRQKIVHSPVDPRRETVRKYAKKGVLKARHYGQLIRYAAINSSPPDLQQILQGLSLVIVVLWMWIKEKCA